MEKIIEAYKRRDPILPYAISAGAFGFLAVGGLFKDEPLIVGFGLIYIGYVFWLKHKMRGE
jgi:hypothetical protein